MTRLSVNINKVATLRNARGENIPDVVKFAIDCERFGAQGITVHPRPDERHITRRDVYDLRKVVNTEFNIEGYPSDDFMRLVIDVKPEQVTLVPDAPGDLTSSAGWNVVANSDFLAGIVMRLRQGGIRSSIFVDADPVQIKEAARIGADRVELYTKPYADNFPAVNPDALMPEAVTLPLPEKFEEQAQEAVAAFAAASAEARKRGIGLNAGHDLNLRNLAYFAKALPLLDEVSIGHAIISDALYLGIKETIRQYRSCL
ncbi:MAG: pyridoxine 5'-phosphate synthase [Muribaculaceae bacterium]|nr:pyridoxine 5'-phosphate synthase [Muribaculaceae bacterium]